MNERSNTQNRQSRRSQVLMAASIEVEGESLPVKLRNLSTEGALVEGNDLPSEGTNVLFRKNEIAIKGIVVWEASNRAGIKFNRELDPAAVLRHMSSPRPRASLNHRRPGLGPRNLTLDELRVSANWSWNSGYDHPGD